MKRFVFDKERGETFLVLDEKGMESLRKTSNMQISFTHLSCGHHVFPEIGRYSHEHVPCPICGKTEILSGYEGKHAYMNGREQEIFLMDTQCLGSDKERLYTKSGEEIVIQKYAVPFAGQYAYFRKEVWKVSKNDLNTTTLERGSQTVTLIRENYGKMNLIVSPKKYVK
jgi:predicted RNA-binding Zn-ribbon protein involved in translation (DUF1610 family)